MPYEQNDNNGSLFKNDRKENERQPDYKGSCKVGGIEYWLSSWIKTTEGGKKWMSVAFQAKEQQAEPSQPIDKEDAQNAPQVEETPNGDDCPF